MQPGGHRFEPGILHQPSLRRNAVREKPHEGELRLVASQLSEGCPPKPEGEGGLKIRFWFFESFGER